MKARKILITGAAGFIGSNLVDYLLKDGVASKDLRLLIAPWDNLDNLENKDLDIFRADIRDKDSLKHIMKDIDVVYHLAALTMRARYTEKDYDDTNFEGTKNILSAMRGSKVKKFVFFSSIAVFGLPAYVGNMRSWDEKSKKFFPEPYGKSKWKADELVKKVCKSLKVSYSIVRPTTAYGPRDYQNLFELFRVIKNHTFVIIGDGENKMDYIYVTDLVKGARLAELSKKKEGDYILGGGEPVTLEKISLTIARSLSVKIPSFKLPFFVAMPISYLVKLIYNTVGVKPPLFPDRVKVMTSDCYFDINHAKNELGYNPEISFDKGVELTAKWLFSKKII